MNSNLGIERGTVRLVNYDPVWQKFFQEEKKLLLNTFSDDIIAIEHIGSTSIPGMLSKPIIDINAAVTTLDNIDKFIETLPELGYEYIPERRFTDRHFFPKGPEHSRTHYLNLVELTSKTGWRNPILFRDYLINDEESFKEYVNLKRSLATKYSNDRYEYTKKKAEFIQKTIKKASQA